MPEMVASYSSQRFSALLDFQRDVDLVCPSHLGNKSPSSSSMAEGYLRVPSATKANHHRGRHGDTFWQESWSESLSALLSSSFQRAAPSPSPPRSCAVEAARRSSPSSSFTTTALTRSQGQFSPQKFIRNALKRAFARDDAPSSSSSSSSSVMVKRARFEDFGSTAVPMVCG